MSLASIIGLGYSGYAIIDGIAIPLLPSGVPETENIIKSEGAFSPDPSNNVGQLPARQRRSLNVSFQTNVTPTTLTLLKPLTYGWRASEILMDNLPEVPFTYVVGTGEGFTGYAHIDEVTLDAEPEKFVTMGISLTSWHWTELYGDSPLTRLGTPVLSPFLDPGYKPIAGWNCAVRNNVISPSAVVQRYSLKLANSWIYENFLAGYPYPPNPALITAGPLDVKFDISWLAQRGDRPLVSGWFQIWIGGNDPANGDALNTIYLSNMVREPRAFDGGGAPNQPILWNTTYFGVGPIPRSNW